MNIDYAFVIIDLICERCMETQKITVNILYTGVLRHCLIYYESKSCILYMNIVYAFVIIDLICDRCMETQKIIAKTLYTGV